MQPAVSTSKVDNPALRALLVLNNATSTDLVLVLPHLSSLWGRNVTLHDARGTPPHALSAVSPAQLTHMPLHSVHLTQEDDPAQNLNVRAGL